MAIKGKKRSRGGRKAPARPPRPKLVVRKPPLIQRTWFRLTLVAVLIAGAGAVTWGVIAARRATAEREEAQREVTQVGAQIETAITVSGGIISSGSVVYQDIAQTLGEIVAGEAKPRQVENRVQDWSAGFQQAAQRLDGIETGRRDLSRSIQRVGRGFDAFIDFLAGLPDLVGLEGKKLQNAAAELQTGFGRVNGIVNSGWLIYLNERVDVGLDEGTPGIQTFPPGQNPFAPPGPGEVPQPAPSG